MQCPVCCTPANNLTPATYDGVVVGCRSCGEYQVTATVFNKLLRLNVEARTDALERAKRLTVVGARPTISTSCF